MIRSIRRRLHLWYGTVFTLSILIFGSLVYWRADRETHDRAVAQAVSMAKYIDVTLRSSESIPEEQALRAIPMELYTPTPPPPRLRGDRRDGPQGRPNPPRNNSNRSIPTRPAMDSDIEPNAVASKLLVDSDRSSFGKDRPARPVQDIGPRRQPLDQMEYVVKKSDGSTVASSPGATSEQLAHIEITTPIGPEPRVSESQGVIEAHMLGPRDSVIVVARPMFHDVANLHRFGLQIFGIGTMTLIVGLIGGSWISRRMVQPIEHIAATAASISAQNLTSRIDSGPLDEELQPLAKVLNETFGRLEGSFNQLTQFTADASHELRTPIAIIQSQVELALSKPRSTEEYRETLVTCLRSTDRMRTLVDGLLMLARADADRLDIAFQKIDLRNIVEEAISHLHERAYAAGVELECQTPDDFVVVFGDRPLLLQVPINLLENAIRHTPRGGRVSVELKCQDGFANLVVQDTGSGIAPEHQEKIFERFYRVDEGRSREQGGNGLGLSICKALLHVHKGTIECSSELDRGSKFTVRIPLATNSPSEERAS